jgi:diguanylate cyclase
MTFLRRQEDIQSEEEKIGLIHTLKRTALMLISAIRFFAEDYEGLKSRQFKGKLDEESHQLKNALTLNEITDIHERLKTLIFQQGEQEKEYRQKQLEEYSKIVETLFQGVALFTSGNTLFTDRLDSQLGLMHKTIELADLKRVRAQLMQELTKARQMVAEKRQQDEQLDQQLTRQVQLLNAQLNIAKEEGRIDGLTGAYNRRAFDRHVEDEFQRCRTVGGSFGVMLFDIDLFKEVNDTHGHQVGDRLLKAIVEHAKHCTRTGDFVARYGGDEFAIVLQGGSAADAYKVLERFRMTVATRTFRYPKSDGTSETLRVTISGGIAWLRQSDTIESLIHRADQALYLAKQLGKNRICTDDELDRKEEAQENERVRGLPSS